MTDLVNQGKGNLLELWNTNDNNKLREIKEICDEFNIDFWNPTNEEKKLVEYILDDESTS